MKIGKLKKVDIRELWKGEASEFTPWLAKEENIFQLGEAIGIELEVIEQERNVGPFRADILCRNTINDNFVLIENQLERTDHTHLGQILTYAAGLDAVIVIWIARQFTEEHRATIDWLNRITNEQCNFFGIEIEAYQIGESMLAPMFQVISKPNDWSRKVRTAAVSQILSDIERFNLEYWTAMKSYFVVKKTFIKNQKPGPQTATYFSVGRSDFSMGAVINSRENFLRVDLYINTDTSKDDLRKLKDMYEQDLYKLINDRVVWDEMPDKKMSLINVKKTADIKDRMDWPNQHQWFLETLEKFDKFFRPKIKQI